MSKKVRAPLLPFPYCSSLGASNVCIVKAAFSEGLVSAQRSALTTGQKGLDENQQRNFPFTYVQKVNTVILVRTVTVTVNALQKITMMYACQGAI